MISMFSFLRIRPTFVPVSALSLAAAALLTTGCVTRPAIAALASRQDYLVYIGTNIAGPQENTIFLYRLNASTGALTAVSAHKGGAQPTYLALDAQHHYLYAVSETQTYKDFVSSGGVSALAINQRTGALKLLNQMPALGASPCYISLDRTEKEVLVANYVGGNVTLLPRLATGQLAPPADNDLHEPPTGPHKNQDKAHAHCIVPSPDNRYVFAVDLGTDKVYRYPLDLAHNKLSKPAEVAFTAKPGAGPRHLAFHPNGRWAFLENELNSTVTALLYDAKDGSFQEIHTLSTLPAGFTGENSGADVHVSPDGHFVYTSNRGDNSLAVFSVDEDSGQLTLEQHISTQGKTPRNFAIDPSGQILLVANQNSNNVLTYQVDKRTGRLTLTGQSVQVPSPMFVAVVPDFTK